MTKEDLLRDHDKYAWECDESEHVVPYSEAEKAMDEYAKQQAIAFAIHYAEGHVAYLKTLRKDPDPAIIASDRLDIRYDHFIENQSIEQQNK